MKNVNVFNLLACSLTATSLSLTALPVQGAEQTMTISSFAPPTHLLSPIIHDLAVDLSEASGGEVTFEIYEAEALGKAVEHLDLAIEGLADLSIACTLYTPSRFPLSLMFELPFFAESAEVSNKVAHAILDAGLLDGEMEEFEPFILFTTAPAQVFSTTKLEKREDFNGLRIIGLGPVWTRTWSLLGAQGVNMGWPDIYLALERGAIDATPGNWAASDGWKWQEVVEYPTDISIMGGFFCGVFMNKESWASLAPETQEKWRAVAADYSPRISKAYDDRDEVARDIWREAGRTIVQFPPDERLRVAEATLPIWKDWVADNEAAGRPARQIYDVYVETMNALGQTVVMQLPD